MPGLIESDEVEVVEDETTENEEESAKETKNKKIT